MKTERDDARAKKASRAAVEVNRGSFSAQLGRLLKTLEQTGLASNTLVVFMSDNGSVTYTTPAATCNAPLTGGKAMLFEGGNRGVLEFPRVCICPLKERGRQFALNGNTGPLVRVFSPQPRKRLAAPGLVRLILAVDSGEVTSHAFAGWRQELRGQYARAGGFITRLP